MGKTFETAFLNFYNTCVDSMRPDIVMLQQKSSGERSTKLGSLERFQTIPKSVAIRRT